MNESIINTHEAKTKLSQLIERAMAGERIVIAKAGKPRVVLTPLPSCEPRLPGRFAGQIHIQPSFDEPITDEELREWEHGHPDDPLRLLSPSLSSPSPRES